MIAKTNEGRCGCRPDLGGPTFLDSDDENFRRVAYEGAALRFARGSARRLRYEVPWALDDNSPEDVRPTATAAVRAGRKAGGSGTSCPIGEKTMDLAEY